MVTAAIFADGHDQLGTQLLYQRAGERKWRIAPLAAQGNDIWTGSFKVDKQGEWRFTILGWVDHFITWESELRKRLAAQGDAAKAVAAADADATRAQHQRRVDRDHRADRRSEYSARAAHRRDPDQEGRRARPRRRCQEAG